MSVEAAAGGVILGRVRAEEALRAAAGSGRRHVVVVSLGEPPRLPGRVFRWNGVAYVGILEDPAVSAEARLPGGTPCGAFALTGQVAGDVDRFIAAHPPPDPKP